MPIALIVCWYIFCGLNIFALGLFMRRITHSRFRDDRGDVTTEVGYEEDCDGRDLKEGVEEFTDQSLHEQAHFDFTANPHTGPM